MKSMRRMIGIDIFWLCFSSAFSLVDLYAKHKSHADWAWDCVMFLFVPFWIDQIRRDFLKYEKKMMDKGWAWHLMQLKELSEAGKKESYE